MTEFLQTNAKVPFILPDSITTSPSGDVTQEEPEDDGSSCGTTKPQEGKSCEGQKEESGAEVAAVGEPGEPQEQEAKVELVSKGGHCVCLQQTSEMQGSEVLCGEGGIRKTGGKKSCTRRCVPSLLFISAAYLQHIENILCSL